LAFKEVSQLNATPVFETLVEQSQLQEPIFGFVLAESNSELILGGRDTSWFKGDLTYVPVTVMVRISRCVPCLYSNTDMQAYWQTVTQGFTVNKKDVQVSNKDAIIDTAVTQIIGAAADIANIYRNIPGSALLAQSDSLWTGTFVTELTVRVANYFTRK
jgi:Eukaryotic aspartyl protease